MSYICIQNPPNTTYLDHQLLSEDGRIKLLPAAAYAGIPDVDLVVWCARQARYCLPTVELVDWLRDVIGSRSCIEIGAGNGDLCYHLGIQGVDNFHQNLPDVKAYYDAIGQAITRPTPGVLQMEANDAVRIFKPRVVIGAWITHKWVGGTIGNMNGPTEEDIISRVETYIHIGNHRVHDEKPALRLPHECVTFPWLISRSLTPESNAIWVWRRHESPA